MEKIKSEIIKSGYRVVAHDYFTQSYEDRQREKGLKLKIYFDTYDVVKMVQGLRVFNDKMRFDMNSFKNPSTLVHAFAFKRYLSSPIHMLPPHQQEFTNLILRKDSHAFPKVKEYLIPIIDDFMGQTQVDKIKEELSEIDFEKVDAYLKRLKLDAEIAFKCHYLLDPSRWQDRLKQMYKNKALNLSGDCSFLVKNITSDKFYIKIKKALDKHRTKGYLKSNFIDSIALTILKNELDLYKKDPINNPLPIFYATSKGIINAVKTIQRQDEKFIDLRSW